MRLPLLSRLSLLAAAAVALSAHAAGDTLVRFEGAIGVDPLTASGGQLVTNTVRGIAPGGRGWVLPSFDASVRVDGRIRASGRGLLFSSGEVIATRGGVGAVVLTLFCGPADPSAQAFTSPAVPLDAAGNFRVDATLSEDGVNPATMPAACDNPQLLVRGFNTNTNLPGGWFAAGIARLD